MTSPNDPLEPPIRSDSKQSDWQYSGRELESMSFAVNYHRWILERLRPFLGKRIVEVGAGTGSFSELLMETQPESFIPLEPSANMFPVLARRLLEIDRDKVSQPHQSTLGALLSGTVLKPSPDSVVYVNVLEHIEDDKGELRAAHSILAPGGRVLIFVPANMWLMGSMDHILEHHRRYTMNELVSKCSAAGFTIRYRAHFDVLGIAPWWLKYCVLKSKLMEPAAVRLYDQLVVPFSRILERMIPPPIGKNIIVVGEKTHAP